MTKIGLDLFWAGTNFLPLACPFCGAVQNLDVTIEGYWDCDICGKGFWISFARVVTVDEPAFSRVVFNAPDDEAIISK